MFEKAKTILRNNQYPTQFFESIKYRTLSNMIQNCDNEDSNEEEEKKRKWKRKWCLSNIAVKCRKVHLRNWKFHVKTFSHWKNWIYQVWNLQLKGFFKVAWFFFFFPFFFNCFIYVFLMRLAKRCVALFGSLTCIL